MWDRAAGEASRCAARPYPGRRARDYHLALPAVATTLRLLETEGANAEIWRRYGRPGLHGLADALDNPDGDRLLAAERERSRAERQVRQAAEREQQRPPCRRCGAKFTDERWRSVSAWDDGLCDDCRQAGADRADRQRTEQERETGENAATATSEPKAGPWWRRRSCRPQTTPAEAHQAHRRLVGGVVSFAPGRW